MSANVVTQAKVGEALELQDAATLFGICIFKFGYLEAILGTIADEANTARLQKLAFAGQSIAADCEKQAASWRDEFATEQEGDAS